MKADASLARIQYEGLNGDSHVVLNHGQLTTEHPASSYGLPVYVADNGEPYGPADILALGAYLSLDGWGDVEDKEHFLSRCEAAGYSFGVKGE